MITPVFSIGAIQGVINLVKNGYFNSGLTTSWQFVTCTGDASTKQLVVTASGGSANVRQTLTTVTGKTYKAKISFIGKTTSKNLNFNIGTSSTGSQLGTAVLSTAGDYTFNFVASGTTTYLSLVCSSTWISGEQFTVDNIEVL